MRWAKERRGGKIVSAASAKAWGDYRCPTCSASVFLRSGKYYAEHFAHKAGLAKPDCENFHPAFDLSRSPYAAPTPHEPKSVDPLQLSIELEPDAEKQGSRKWRLCLTVPKAFDSHGQITVDLGLNDRRPISLAKLSVGAETFAVQPDTEDFGASWVSPEVRPGYRDVVQDRIPGLDRATLNVFAATRSKQKPRTYSLSWGEAYYLVTHSDKPVTLPPSLPNKPLARVKGWDCVLALLPHDPSPEIEAWCRQFGDMPVGRAQRDWALLYPAPLTLGDAGDLHIPSNDYIVVALKSADPTSEREFSVATGSSHTNVELAETTSNFVVVSAGNRVTGNHVYLTWGDAYVATLTTTSIKDAAAPIVVRIRCDGPDLGGRADFHHSSSLPLLSDVRRGHRKLVAVSGHPLLQGVLRWRRYGSPWEQHTIAFGPLPNALVDDALLGKINSALQDSSLHVELNFGPFGRFAAEALPEPDPVTIPAETRLPSPLRARLEWLSVACQSYVDSSRRPIAVLSDASLIAHFDGLRIPTKLLAHKRVLQGELKHLGFEVGHV